MAAVFAGFIGRDNPMVGSIAVTLSVGVLADAFVVRMVIMPAVLVLAGRGAGGCHAGWRACCRTSTWKGRRWPGGAGAAVDGDRVPVGAGDQAG